MVIKIVQKIVQIQFPANNSFTIHQRNLQLLTITFFKVIMNISPEIMNEIFDFLKNSAYELRRGNYPSR